MKRTVTTLAIIEDNNKILLGMKKRGFGKGWWNGFGGKIEENEPIDRAMTREFLEESGLKAEHYRKRGELNFYFEGKDEEVVMHVYEISQWSGELRETDEMKPRWFDKDNIPFDQMWPADRGWMTLYLDGKDFEGRATFDGETKALIKSEFWIKTGDSEGKDYRNAYNREKLG